MNALRTTQLIATLLGAAALLYAPGCDRKQEPAPAGSGQSKAPPASTDGHDHNADAGGAHDRSKDDQDHGHGHGGAAIDLGSAAIGTFEVRASRDEGKIAPGEDAPIDLVATPAPGSSGKIAAVRLWIGTQDAKGSIKAKADVEDAKAPTHWHAHVEIPNPIPAGSKLWVEVESDRGEKSAGAFDLKL